MKTMILMTLTLLAAVSQAAVQKATYEVPTSQEELKAASIFAISKVSLTTSQDNITTLSYQLPTELTGIENNVEFSGRLINNAGKLSSKDGVIDCMTNKNKMMCNVSYQAIDMNNELAQQIMGAKFKDVELSQRLQIQQKFSTDPIGIIRIKMKP